MIMTTDNNTVIDYINQCKQETRKATLADIAFPRGCNNIPTYAHPLEIYKKGCPIHVRGIVAIQPLHQKTQG